MSKNIMKKLLLLTLLLATNICFSQFIGNKDYEDGTKLEFKEAAKSNDQGVKDDNALKSKIRIFISKDGKKKLEPKDISIGILKKKDTFKTNIDNVKIIYEITDKNKIIFQLMMNNTVKPNTKNEFIYCKDKFVVEDKCPDSDSKKQEEEEEGPYTDITQIDYPVFKFKNEKRVDSKHNRYLVIDATPNIKYKINNTLYKRKNPENFDPTKPFDIIFKRAAALNTKGTLSVFIKNFNPYSIENITVKLNGTDYSYSKGLSDLYDPLKKSSDKEDSDTDALTGVSASLEEGKSIKERTKYLKKVLDILDNIDYLNENDLEVLKKYKSILKETYLNKELDIELNEEGLMLYREIMAWYPNHISLTPIAIIIPDADDVEMIVSIKNKNVSQPSEHKVGKYRVAGGFSVDMGSRVYLTGLKNNNVFTDSVDVNGNKELRAGISTKNQQSLGIGLNAEIAFRTGEFINPTFNVGFFVPFDEDLTPFFAVGPGFSISGSKVKLSFSGGIAYGKVNSISERFVDRDLSEFSNLTNESLIEKIWDSSWYCSIGVSFNL